MTPCVKGTFFPDFPDCTNPETLNPEANKERLEKQRLAKVTWCKKKKLKRPKKGNWFFRRLNLHVVQNFLIPPPKLGI